MNDEQIGALKMVLKNKNQNLIWISPFDSKAYNVKTIGLHAEEGDDSPCAIFTNGEYVALYNCELQNFYTTNCLKED